MLAALDHHRDRILRLIVGREAGKPRDRVFLAFRHRLRGAGFSRDLHPAQPRLSTGPAIFIHDFPQTAPRQLDLFRSEIESQIAMRLLGAG